MQEAGRVELVGSHRPARGHAAAAAARTAAPAVPHRLGRRRAGRLKRRAPDPDHLRLARGIVDRQGGAGVRPAGVAVLSAVVAGRGDERLTLHGGLLEQHALGLLGQRPELLLALSPGDRHDPRAILVDDCAEHVVGAGPGHPGRRIGALVDEHVRARREPDQVLDVERRLVAARA